MSQMPKELLFDWETVLLQGPMLDRWAASTSLRLSESRQKVRAVLGDLDATALRTGKINLRDLIKGLAEALGREIARDEMTECLQAGVIYDLDGLSFLSRWAALGKAAVVGASPPRVPEKLRADLVSLVPPERHVYAHEAGHSNHLPEFYAVVAEALGAQVTDLVLLSGSPEALEAARAAGSGAVLFRGALTELALD